MIHWASIVQILLHTLQGLSERIYMHAWLFALKSDFMANGCSGASGLSVIRSTGVVCIILDFLKYTIYTYGDNARLVPWPVSIVWRLSAYCYIYTHLRVWRLTQHGRHCASAQAPSSRIFAPVKLQGYFIWNTDTDREWGLFTISKHIYCNHKIQVP